MVNLANFLVQKQSCCWKEWDCSTWYISASSLTSSAGSLTVLYLSLILVQTI